jgi:hypothetical protein
MVYNTDVFVGPGYNEYKCDRSVVSRINSAVIALQNIAVAGVEKGGMLDGGEVMRMEHDGVWMEIMQRWKMWDVGEVVDVKFCNDAFVSDKVTVDTEAALLTLAL